MAKGDEFWRRQQELRVEEDKRLSGASSRDEAVLLEDMEVPEEEIILADGGRYSLKPESPPEEGEGPAEGRPRRAYRFRRVMKLWDKGESKKLFLRIYRLTGDIEESCRNIDRAQSTVRLWASVDQAFKAGWEAIDKMWATVLDGSLRNMDAVAVEVLRDTLQQVADKRLRVEVAVKLLRSHGYLPEKAEVEHTGPGGKPIQIIHSVEVRPPGGNGQAGVVPRAKELEEG